MGADYHIADKFTYLDGEKYLLYIGHLNTSLANEIKEKYGIKNIFCINPFKYFLKRTLRFFLSKVHLNIFYHLKNPYHFSIFTKKKVKKICEKNNINCVLVEYVWFGRIIDEKKINALKIIETHDIQSVFCQSVKKEDKKWKLSITEKEELSICKKYDYVLAISKNDFDYYKQKQCNAFYLPPIRKKNTEFLPVKKSVLNIGFIGGVAEFNVAAIEWFMKNVFSKDGDYVLNIYGKVCDKLDYPYENVKKHGFVENFDEVYTNNHIFINPTFVVGGIKTKNVEALGYGKIVLTTKEGARGLESFVDNKSLYTFDDPDEYKKKIDFFSKNLSTINNDGVNILKKFNELFANEEIMVLNNEIKEKVNNL